MLARGMHQRWLRDFSLRRLCSCWRAELAVEVVALNSDISSGDCPADKPTMTDGPEDLPCADPAIWNSEALADALGQPVENQ
jgi:hypothetical protein